MWQKKTQINTKTEKKLKVQELIKRKQEEMGQNNGKIKMDVEKKEEKEQEDKGEQRRKSGNRKRNA